MLGAASRRTVLGALAALSVTCQAQVTPPPSHAEGDAPTVEAAEAEARFDPELARVDPASAIGRARAHLEAGDAPGARSTALGALDGASSADRGVLLWIAGRAAERAGDPAAAADSYASIADEHPLARWARLSTAQIRAATDTAATIALLAPLLEERWPGRDEARALDAIARVEAADPEAEARLRTAIANMSGSPRATLERALAELLVAREDEGADADAAGAEAVTLLRWIDARAPGSRSGREAAVRAAAILATISEEPRRAITAPTLEQQLVRAEALAAAMDHQGAEDAFGALAGRLPRAAEGVDHERRCEARLGQGRSMFRRRARREAAALLVPLADECRDRPEVRAWARYYAGKSLSGQDLPREAIAQYDVLAEELPEHRLADDALVTAARLAADRGDDEGMRTRLERVIDMPGADMRGEARFLLAWHARSAGRLDDALAQLDASIAEGAGETGEDQAGRAAYWRARLLEQLGRHEDSALGYESVARALPLSYYAQQAIARLAALDPERARIALPPAAGAAPALRFAMRAELVTPAFARALGLLRAGEFSMAERELAAAGLTAEDASSDALWIAAALLDRAGAHSRACELARRRLRGPLMQSMPTGRALALWRIAYPRAFHPMIDGAAQTEGVPASFIRAIAREESSFRPDAVSVAHAYGLLQIIRPTAQRIARPLGIASDAVALRTPEINVRIGARYMAGLRRRFDPNPALVPAAYNAGEGAVERWIRERPDHALDEFIETIPYDETRRYSRRVLQTWGVYGWLDEGTLPSWPAALPSRSN